MKGLGAGDGLREVGFAELWPARGSRCPQTLALAASGPSWSPNVCNQLLSQIRPVRVGVSSTRMDHRMDCVPAVCPASGQVLKGPQGKCVTITQHIKDAQIPQGA